MAAIIYKTNTSPSLFDTIKVNGQPFDLTSSSVKLQMRLETAKAGDPLKIDAAAVVVAPTAGTVRYDWVTGDVDTAAEYVAWWRITLPSTKVQDSDEFPVTVRDHGLQTANLCSLADVRSSLELPPSETTRDQLILELIPVASKMLMDYCEREFAPISTALTRRLQVDQRLLGQTTINIVDLAPFDLAAVTGAGVVMNPESSSPQTLVANTDYQLHPLQTDEGVYTSLRLSNFINFTSDNMIRFGHILFDVTGTWGWPTLPPTVSEACSDSVSAWMRRDVSTLGLNLQDGMNLSPDFIASFDLPLAAIRKVNSYRRNVGAF
jgi:hypothetical protein